MSDISTFNNPQARVICLAQLSDCHLFADPLKTAYNGIVPYDSLKTVLHSLAQQQIDCLLVTGDLSGDGSLASYQHFSGLIAHHLPDCAFVVIPGNHDEPAVMQAHFHPAQLWTTYPPYTPLTLGNWQVHLLNTKTAAVSGELSSEDLQGLSQALEQASASDCFQILAAHHHPLPCHSWMDKHGWHKVAELLSLVRRTASVKALVHGHIHHASEQQLAQCTVYACPSTCWQWAMQPQFGLSQQAAGYRLLYLHSNGNIDSRVIRTRF